MVLHIVLFILYGLLCLYGLLKLPFFRRSGTRPRVLVFLFALHVLIGCLHNVIAWRYYPGHGDVWKYFFYSLSDRREIFTDFHRWLADNNTWSYASHNAVIWVHLVLNLLSADNLYINTLLFSFPVFMGTTALWMVFRRRFDEPLTPLVCAFLLPSAVFWTSCIHREGILFMLLGFFLTGFDRLLTMGFDRHRRARPIIRCLLLLLLIAYVRDFVAILMIPALLVWAAIVLPAARRPLLLATVATTFTLILLILFLPGLDLPAFITRRQQEFFFLEGHSRLYLPALDGSWHSLLHELPIALLNGWFEPLPGSGGRSIYLLFSIELAIIWLIAVWALITLSTHRHPSPASRPASPSPASSSPASSSPSSTLPAPATPAIRRDTPPSPTSPSPASPSPRSRALPFALFCILFALTGMLLIGIVIPFAGAIVRYRSIYLPFLLAPFLHTLGNLQPFRLFNVWLSDRVINKL